MEGQKYTSPRRRMVEQQLAGRDIRDPEVLQAFLAVPRHLFVPEEYRQEAYADHPLPIAEGQTISQPYIVALMTQALGIKRGDKVLEIGTGCGYQSAILAWLGALVYGVEIHPSLAQEAKLRMLELKVPGVQIRCGDGTYGWKEEAPFDAILVAAAPAGIPLRLVQQLKVGGRLVIPVGTWTQMLSLFTKLEDGRLRQTDLCPVRFVPMTGQVLEEEGRW